MRVFRTDFPILKRNVHGKPLVYFDNAATTQKPKPVLDAIQAYYATMNANPHRGVHTLAEEATTAYETARATVARFIGARDLAEIIFVRNTTEAINLVARTYVRAKCQVSSVKCQIVLSAMEHHSNIVPWQMLKQQDDVTTPHPSLKRRGDVVIRYIPVTPNGELDLSTLDELITEDTAIVSVTYVSNVLGTVNDIKTIVQHAHAKGVPVLVDAAQAVGHLPVNVEELGCDFLAFSGHKMFAPMGIGALWAKREHLEKMTPMLGGGDMISSVSYDTFTVNDLPWRFEAGTPNVEGAIGFAAAIDFIDHIGIDRIHAHEQELTAYALAQLHACSGVRVYGLGATSNRSGIIAFSVDDMHPHDLATLLDREGIAIRAGYHCAEPLVRALADAPLARISFSLYNTKKEVDVFIAALTRAQKIFRV